MGAITLLDGGMGQELVHRAGEEPTPLWSTQVMVDHPGMVAQVHRDFAAAGATVATSNTYAIHRDRLEGTEFEDAFEDLIARALNEVRTSGAARVAGAIGPLIASYRPDLHPDAATAIPLYAEVARLLGPACDVLICETVVSVLHAQTVLAGAAEAGKPIWLSFSVDDEDGTRLRSGEALIDVVPHVWGKVAAVLVNCSAPEAIPAALEVLATCRVPYGAYANAFEQITDDFLKEKPTVDALKTRRDLTPEAHAAHVLSWVEQGATIVGGCCEVGPSHIAEITRSLRAAGHTIV